MPDSVNLHSSPFRQAVTAFRSQLERHFDYIQTLLLCALIMFYFLSHLLQFILFFFLFFFLVIVWKFCEQETPVFFSTLSPCGVGRRQARGRRYILLGGLEQKINQQTPWCRRQSSHLGIQSRPSPRWERWKLSANAVQEGGCSDRADLFLTLNGLLKSERHWLAYTIVGLYFSR